MLSGIFAFLFTAGAVTLAEMGDKTQLLAMCFAARYKAGKVLAGVFAATILNHAAAVAAGYFLKEVLSAHTTTIQMVASLSFIGFALWTIKGDSVDDSCDVKSKFGPVITVAIAFFIAEMGDKTQLATVALATQFENPYAVLAGTTTGMIIADGIGIIFGVVMNKKIPEKVLKWISAGLFAAFGVIGYISSGSQLMSTWLLAISMAAIVVAAAFIAFLIVRGNHASNAANEITAAIEDNKCK